MVYLSPTRYSMLPQNHRLPGHRIPSLIRTGKRVAGPYATLIINTVEENTVTTFTGIVPIRLSKKAVARNRTRRLLREAIHHHMADIKTGYEVLVMAQKIMTNEKIDAIQPHITRLLQKARLLK